MKTAADSKIIHYHFDSEHKYKSNQFVIARILVQHTNLHLKAGRSSLGAKLNVIKSKVWEKIKIKQ